MIAAASEQRGEGRLEGEGPRPRQPRADHPQPLRPRQALLLLDVVECLLEVLRRDVQCLQWLHRTMQASMSRAYLHLSLHVYEGCDHCDLQTCLLKPTCRLAACCPAARHLTLATSRQLNVTFRFFLNTEQTSSFRIEHKIGTNI